MLRRLLVLVYRAARRVLPPAFRSRWSAELCAVFDERLAREGVRGALREVVDVVVTGVRLRAQALGAALERKGEIVQLLRGVTLDARAVRRSLRRQPVYAVAAVCTIAVGVGAATALFGVFDQVVVQPLPHADSDRLYMVWRELPEYRIERASVSYATYLDVARGADAFVSAGAYTSVVATLSAGGEPERIRGASVSGTLFALLGNAPLRGRAITEADDAPGAEPVIVLSRGLWQRQYGGSTDALGRTVLIGETPHRIIGVMPASFVFPSPLVEFWIPLRLDAAAEERDTHRFAMIARLAPGASLERASSQINALHAALQREYPDIYTGRMWLEQRQDYLVGDAAGVLRALLWAALFLTVAGAANFAGMLLVRAAARQRESAVALALGAGRLRSARPLVLESLLLSATGCALGVMLAGALMRAVQLLGPDTLPRRLELGLDVRAIMFAVTVSLVTAVACALLSSWRLARRASTGGIAVAAARFGDRAARRTQSALVIGQVAVAFVLLTGSVLFTTSLLRLLDVPVGFEREKVLTAYVSLPPAKYDSPERIRAFYDAVLASLRATPGVTHAGGTWALPFSEDYASTSYTADASDAEGVTVSATAVRGDYFDALGMRLLRGRSFDRRDTPEADAVVVINERMAQLLFGEQDPVGRLIRKPDGSETARVIGVTGDVRRRELSADVEPEVYYPHDQSIWNGDFYIVVRAADNPMALVPLLRGAIRAQDASLPVMRVATLHELVSRSVAAPRFRTLVLLSLAAAACILAVLGVYGSLSWLVAASRREIALRVALGAQPRRVAREIIARGGRLALTGIAIGAVGAAVSVRMVRSLLFGVGTLDPAAYLAAAVLILLATTAAAAVPARRAGAVDAGAALREE